MYAMVEPMLITASRLDTIPVKTIALSGTSLIGPLWGTEAKKLRNGNPWSRAKANSWREAVAMFAVALNIARQIIMETIAVVPLTEPVAL